MIFDDIWDLALSENGIWSKFLIFYGDHGDQPLVAVRHGLQLQRKRSWLISKRCWQIWDRRRFSRRPMFWDGNWREVWDILPSGKHTKSY